MVNASEKELNDLITKYSNLQEKFIAMGGYEIDTQISKIIAHFKLDKLVDKKYSSLSGGEKRIVSLAAIMIKKPSILLLDEPTNHIDITTKELLEEALKDYQGTVIFISHDRYFINELADKILYIENNKLKEYIGNYDDYKIKEH